MPASLRAVFFDVDGVLIDSLPQHLQICRDKAREFGLRLKIPNVDEFRELVRRGIKVSPMRHFFLARIDYPDAEPGYLIYVKPTLTGDEEADLQAYIGPYSPIAVFPASDAAMKTVLQRDAEPLPS